LSVVLWSLEAMERLLKSTINFTFYDISTQSLGGDKLYSMRYAALEQVHFQTMKQSCFISTHQQLAARNLSQWTGWKDNLRFFHCDFSLNHRVPWKLTSPSQWLHRSKEKNNKILLH
jgi:hypothetical protein